MKSIKYVRLYLANGETKLEQVKTTTDRYIKNLIADIAYRLPAKVTSWEVIAL